MNTSDFVLYTSTFIFLRIFYSAEANNTQTIVVGGEITLNCIYHANARGYRWQKYNNIDNSYHDLTDTPQKYHGTRNNQMTIQNTQSTDAGKYQCLLFNENGTNFGSGTHITLVYGYNLTIVAGSEVTLHCYINMYGYRWQKYNNADNSYHKLTDTQRYYGADSNQLTIQDTQSNDSGIYRCAVFDENGVNIGVENPITLVVVTHGNWEVWSSWNSCPVKCGTGIVTRTRQCNNSAPSGVGLHCSGINQETQNCTADLNCPVDGNWTAWSEWSHCTTSCGAGNRTRTRNCTNPSPLYGGNKCTGGNLEDDICSSNDCQASLSLDGNVTGAAVGGAIGAVIVLLIIMVIVVILRLKSKKEGSTEHNTKSSNKHLYHAGGNVISRPEPSCRLSSLNTIQPNDQDNVYLKLERVTSMTNTNNHYDELHAQNDVTSESDPDKVYYNILPDNSPKMKTN